MSATRPRSHVAGQALVLARRSPALGLAVVADRKRLPGQLRRLLVDLGPAYAKIGQVLSTRADTLPESYLAVLATLRDAMPPESPDAIAAVLSRAFPDGTGMVFSTFEDEPFAAGTVAQVHRGRLKTGEKVAVKILRPGVHAELEANFALLLSAAATAQRLSKSVRAMDMRGLVLELRDLLLSQTDLDREARNYRRLRRHFADDPTVVIPRVFPELSTSEVLVTEFVDGIPPYDADRLPVDRLTLARRVDDLLDNMIFLKGLCHADLHPGNFFWTPQGQIVLVDLGLVHQLTKDERNHLLAFYASVLDGFHTFAAEYFLRHFVRAASSREPDAIPARAFSETGQLVRRHWAESGGQPAFSAMFSDLLRVLLRHHLRLKHDYSKLFLTLVTLEGYLYWIEPEFDMLENARRKRVEHAEYASVSDAAHDLVFGEVGSYSAGRFCHGASPEQAYRDRDALVLDSLGVGPGSFLIDVGCGRGQLLRAAESRGARALGITISRAEQQCCLSKGLECVLTSWEDFDRRDAAAHGAADVMTAIELDNHLATLHENRVGLLDLRLSRFFAWARAHLRDDGRLFLQSLAVPDALVHDERLNADYERLSDVAPWLGFSTLPQLVRCSDPFFRLEQALDHSSDLLPTYELWRTNTNRSLSELRPLVGDESLVYLRRQLDTLIWLAERERLQLYRLILRAKGPAPRRGNAAVPQAT